MPLNNLPKINEGFFVINQAAFINNTENRLREIPDELCFFTREVKYIVPQGYIMVDADSGTAVTKINHLIKKLELKPFQYNTAHDRKHYWFRTDAATQKLIDEFKLHSSAHKLSLDNDIDTRSFNTKSNKTGAVYLKRDGKLKSGRPSPEKLLEVLKAVTDVVPIFLLMPKLIGFIPKSGSNWNNTALPIMGKLKYYGMDLETIDILFRQAAIYHGDKHSPSEIMHKFRDAHEVMITSDHFVYNKPKIDPATLAQYHYKKYIEYSRSSYSLDGGGKHITNYINALTRHNDLLFDGKYGCNVTITKLYEDFKRYSYVCKFVGEIPSMKTFKRVFELSTRIPTSVKPRWVNGKKCRWIDLTRIIKRNNKITIDK